MEHSESVTSQSDVAINETEELRGRKGVPVGAANEAQTALIKHMVKEPVWLALTDTERNDLASDWMEKYALGDFNGFAEYCDAHADDMGFMNRAKKGELTTADLESMKTFLEQSPKGTPFIVHH